MANSKIVQNPVIAFNTNKVMIEAPNSPANAYALCVRVDVASDGIGTDGYIYYQLCAKRDGTLVVRGYKNGAWTDIKTYNQPFHRSYMATSKIPLPIAETVLSSPHTIASNTGHVMRYGKIVNFSARITITSDVSAWTAFASVPVGFRPYEVQCNVNSLADSIYLGINGELQCDRNLTANEVMVISFTYYTK